MSETVADTNLLPPVDACASNWCNRPAAEHGDEIYHPFVEPPREPRPERIVEAFIQTQWVCWSCGTDCDVWGVGQGWIECDSCGRDSFLV